MLEPIKKTRLYEDIADQLISLIQDGTLAPGDRLPSERQLAEDLQVSRTAVREALHSLASMGYIESRVGEGTYVKQLTLDSIMHPLSSMLIKDEKLIRELIDVRILLETETAKLAAQAITPDKADKLYESLTIMEESVARGGSGLTGDNAFHNTIADITGNDALRMILNMCGTLLAKSRAATLQLPGQPKKSLADHRTIYEAICSGNSEKAATAMTVHLQKAYRNLDFASIK